MKVWMMKQMPLPISSAGWRAGEFIEEIKDLQGNILISTHAILMKGIPNI